MRESPIDPRRHPRRPSLALALATMVVLVVACAPAGEGSPTPSLGVENGFPLGSFAKQIDDPQAGRVRLVWTFESGGRWAEVPFALDGQTSIFPPVRGTWTVDGETVTIATDFPPGWGWARHAWRLVGDQLWTTYQSSDVPEDAGWFAMLDVEPWIRVDR